MRKMDENYNFAYNIYKKMYSNITKVYQGPVLDYSMFIKKYESSNTFNDEEEITKYIREKQPKYWAHEKAKDISKENIPTFTAFETPQPNILTSAKDIITDEKKNTQNTKSTFKTIETPIQNVNILKFDETPIITSQPIKKVKQSHEDIIITTEKVKSDLGKKTENISTQNTEYKPKIYTIGNPYNKKLVDLDELNLPPTEKENALAKQKAKYGDSPDKNDITLDIQNKNKIKSKNVKPAKEDSQNYFTSTNINLLGALDDEKKDKKDKKINDEMLLQLENIDAKSFVDKTKSEKTSFSPDIMVNKNWINYPLKQEISQQNVKQIFKPTEFIPTSNERLSFIENNYPPNVEKTIQDFARREDYFSYKKQETNKEEEKKRMQNIKDTNIKILDEFVTQAGKGQLDLGNIKLINYTGNETYDNEISVRISNLKEINERNKKQIKEQYKNLNKNESYYDNNPKTSYHGKNIKFDAMFKPERPKKDIPKKDFFDQNEIIKTDKSRIDSDYDKISYDKEKNLDSNPWKNYTNLYSKNESLIPKNKDKQKSEYIKPEKTNWNLDYQFDTQNKYVEPKKKNEVYGRIDSKYDKFSYDKEKNFVYTPYSNIWEERDLGTRLEEVINKPRYNVERNNPYKPYNLQFTSDDILETQRERWGFGGNLIEGVKNLTSKAIRSVSPVLKAGADVIMQGAKTGLQKAKDNILEGGKYIKNLVLSGAGKLNKAMFPPEIKSYDTIIDDFFISGNPIKEKYDEAKNYITDKVYSAIDTKYRLKKEIKDAGLEDFFPEGKMFIPKPFNPLVDIEKKNIYDQDLLRTYKTKSNQSSFFIDKADLYSEPRNYDFDMSIIKDPTIVVEDKKKAFSKDKKVNYDSKSDIKNKTSGIMDNIGNYVIDDSFALERLPFDLDENDIKIKDYNLLNETKLSGFSPRFQDDEDFGVKYEKYINELKTKDKDSVPYVAKMDDDYPGDKEISSRPRYFPVNKNKKKYLKEDFFRDINEIYLPKEEKKDYYSDIINRSIYLPKDIDKKDLEERTFVKQEEEEIDKKYVKPSSRRTFTEQYFDINKPLQARKSFDSDRKNKREEEEEIDKKYVKPSSRKTSTKQYYDIKSRFKKSSSSDSDEDNKKPKQEEEKSEKKQINKSSLINYPSKVTYHDDDNIDKYMLSVKRKRYNDIASLPDKVPLLENFKTIAGSIINNNRH